MKKVVNWIFAIVIILIFALFNGCTMLDPQESQPEQDDLTAPDDKLPQWLLLEHQSTENNYSEKDNKIILAETYNDEDETESVSETITDPDPEPETTSPSDEPSSDKKQDPEPKNEDSDSDDLSPSEKGKINKAKEALREIEKEYRTASSETRVELATRYNHIINKLKNEYGIILENKLEEAEWWKLDRDSSPSFRHEVYPKTD